MKVLRGKRVHYKTNHPLYGSNNTFDSWMTLCEFTMDIAQGEAQRRLSATLVELTSEIADEMMNTAEEDEPQTDH